MSGADWDGWDEENEGVITDWAGEMKAMDGADRYIYKLRSG